MAIFGNQQVGCMCGLGVPSTGEAVSFPSCVFAQGVKSASALKLQELLKQFGASGLKPDGLWGACSESAYKNYAGEALSKASLASRFNFTCGSFSKVAPVGSCKDGSDTVFLTEVAMMSAPPKSDAVTSIQAPPAVVSATGPSAVVPEVATASAVGGIPNWALVMGGLALLGGVFYALKK